MDSEPMDEHQAAVDLLARQFPWLRIELVTWLEPSEHDAVPRYRTRYALLTKPEDATPDMPAIAFGGWSFQEALDRAMTGVPEIQRHDYNRSIDT